MKRTVTIVSALLVSLLFAAVLFAFIARAAVAVPFADELKFGALYAELARGGMPSLSTLMASHNGHPYLLLNLLLALTLHFGWSWSWMMYAQVPVLVLAFWVVLRNLANSTGGGAWPFVAAVGIACSLVTVRLWENLYWGMQISAALCFLFIVLCFDAAARYLREGSGRAAASTAAWGLLAVLSTGAGIFAALIAAVFVAVAALRAGRRRHAWLMAGYAAIALVLFAAANMISGKYGVGYQSFPWLAGIEHLLRMFAHAFLALDPQRNGGLVLGAGVLLAACVLLGLALRRLWKGEDYAFECMVMLLGFALIGSITYARTKYGIFQPTAPRYILFVVPVAIACFMLLCRFRARALLAAACVLVLAGTVRDARVEWDIAPYRKVGLTGHRDALCGPQPGEPAAAFDERTRAFLCRSAHD